MKCGARALSSFLPCGRLLPSSESLSNGFIPLARGSGVSRLTFGPVPSRRLGRSLGVNNIPPKHCTYSCVYCQLGKTPHLEARRREFYDPAIIAESVERTLNSLERGVDYVTFVPDGEPTLDANLGRAIRLIKARVNVRVAVITNASLMHMPDVRSDLSEAYLVSAKVDAISERVWRLINRPHPDIPHLERLAGLRTFAGEYSGRLITETMLVRGVNDSLNELKAIAEYLASLDPAMAYVSVPTRPPAERFVRPPSEATLTAAHEIFADVLGPDRVELLTGYEGPDFTSLGDPIESLLAITSVHPMRVDYARALLERGGLNPEETLRELLARGEVRVVEYRGESFVLRSLGPRRGFHA